MRVSLADTSSSFRWAWQGALMLFILAGLTGMLYRFGLAHGWTAGLDLVNIRHAHSHLMYFGWGTPALFALIGLHLPELSSGLQSPALRWILSGTFAAAVIAYPLFLAFGYTPVDVGDGQMPVAVVGATLNIIAWWTFVAFYVRQTRGARRIRSLLFFDTALTFLVMATLGALGLALLKPLGVTDPVWPAALTHIFLDYFSEGWFVLAVLGLAFSAIPSAYGPSSRFGLFLLVCGLPLTFALGIPSVLVPPVLQVLAKVGAVLVGIGLLLQVLPLSGALLRRGRYHLVLWGLPLALLTFKALGQIAVGVVPGAWWTSLHGLRILYLHLMLLGFVSLGLVAAAEEVWGPAAMAWVRGFQLAVVLVLLSLVPLTTFWPAAWGGAWTFTLAAWISLAPLAAAGGLLTRGFMGRP